MMYTFVSRQEISQHLSISAATLKHYGLGGRLIEGLH